jgi:hypothetical protein
VCVREREGQRRRVRDCVVCVRVREAGGYVCEGEKGRRFRVFKF